MSPKPKPSILEVEGACDKVTENFYRIKIRSGEARDTVYISKEFGIPKSIVINVIPRKEES